MDSFADLVKGINDENAEIRRLSALGLADYGEESIPHLLKTLGDADWRVRKTSVESFLKIGGRRVIESLISSLNIQDNAGARNSAIEALTRIGKEAVPFLINSFEDAHQDVRKFIVDILGEVGDKRATPLFIAALTDRDDNVRFSAIEHLGKIRDEKAINPLLKIFKKKELWLSYPAAISLGNIGDSRVLEPLLDALKEKPLREAALKGLGALGDKRALAQVIKFLKDPSRSIREISLQVIIDISKKNPNDKGTITIIKENIDREISDYLLQSLKREKAQIKLASVRLLGWVGAERAVEPLVNLLQEDELQEKVMEALLILGRGGAIHALIPFLDNPDNIIRRCISYLLGEIGDSTAVEALIKSLSDEDGHVRGNSMIALGKIKDRRAIIPLMDFLNDEYNNVQESAVTALVEIGTEVEQLLPMLSSKESDFRKNIALLLGRLKAKKAVSSLGFVIKDESPEVREAVVKALGMIGGEEAGRFLISALTDEEPRVKMASAIAIGEISYKKGIDSLIILLKDENSRVRAAVARGIGKLKNPAAVLPLIELLDDKDPMVRISVIESLGEIGDMSALPYLLRLLKEKDPELKKITIRTLSKLGFNKVQALEILKELLPLLSDRDWGVRKAVLEVLGRFPEKDVKGYIIKVAETDEDEVVRKTADDILKGKK
ncbi:MAG: HEAT repeat domain-containing protein [Nitrospirae bacterium]|nr:HEAT repeat domain-containing protein [Nitrospirota bacterium]